ncbi:DegT/DnrJ/EryC1/StrS family aminotransferase [Hirschia baltica]|uniref:DegT/DnrJ/EryC1/StrS aminotransferase n=1 Tax=Hirschia baltica (strain ATCC 49814 / DSM 5838 / IFAM 1418) TaxID=582402 RepID=C6XK83_HIRBI|nr:DegT/DnrJ/EryC1/StrS family aminotransferase [Hirschia baltica]ACT59528.1 DegT/DnrJ/EryC1/StrS aminotransferase [Hirschia baltica ATCC 49814]
MSIDLSKSPSVVIPQADESAPIQFFDLQAQQKLVREKVEKRFTTILDHGRHIGGPEVDELEQKLAQATGAADAVAVGSGTQALVMPLIALGYGHGDAVFIPGFTYNATANAVLLAGATPVFVDIDPKTFNMCPRDLERQIKVVNARRDLTARAIMPVDLYGLPADYNTIQAIADAYKLRIIADGAQAFGGKQDGKWVGAIAEITGTSFYPTKTLGGYGDGGAILTTDTDFADVLRSIRWHGTDNQRKLSVRVGINGRCDSIQCAVVSDKLDIFGAERERRVAIANIYDERLTGILPLQEAQPGAENGYGLYTVRVENRDDVRAAMQAEGVPTAVYYDTALHQMQAFTAYAPAGGLVECEKAARESMSIPMHPYLSDGQAHRVCDVLLASLAK